MVAKFFSFVTITLTNEEFNITEISSAVKGSVKSSNMSLDFTLNLTNDVIVGTLRLFN